MINRLYHVFIKNAIDLKISKEILRENFVCDEYSRALRLVSELPDLRAANANSAM